MLIKLTMTPGNSEFLLRAEDVMLVAKANDNILVTMVTTTIMLKDGPAKFAVLESVDDVEEMVNNALSMQLPKKAPN
jgi:hypothetical protein